MKPGDTVRIELSVGSIGQLQNSVKSFYDNINATINSLQNTKKRINNLPGGAQILQQAVNQLDNRIYMEEHKRDAIVRQNRQIATFIDNTVDVDVRVSRILDQNQRQFFNDYSWLKPVYEKEKSWVEKRLDDIRKFWKNTKEAVSKAINSVISFVKEHADEIIIGTTLIIIGAVVVAVTGGTAAAFIPAVLAGLKTAALSAVISGAIDGVVSLITGDDFFKAFGDGLASGYMFGGILSGISLTFSSLLRYSSFVDKIPKNKTIGPFKLWSPNNLNNPNIGGTAIKYGKTYRLDFDVNITEKAFEPLKSHLFHTHITYNDFNKLPSIIRNQKWLFVPARRDVHVRLIPITVPIISNLFRNREK